MWQGADATGNITVAFARTKPYNHKYPQSHHRGICQDKNLTTSTRRAFATAFAKTKTLPQAPEEPSPRHLPRQKPCHKYPRSHHRGICQDKNYTTSTRRAFACGKVFVLANAVAKALRVLVVRFLSWQMPWRRLCGCLWQGFCLGKSGGDASRVLVVPRWCFPWHRLPCHTSSSQPAGQIQEPRNNQDEKYEWLHQHVPESRVNRAKARDGTKLVIMSVAVAINMDLMPPTWELTSCMAASSPWGSTKAVNWPLRSTTTSSCPCCAELEPLKSTTGRINSARPSAAPAAASSMLDMSRLPKPSRKAERSSAKP